MTAISGGLIGPDGLGGQFQTPVEQDRASAWWGVDGYQRVLKGGAITAVSGEMSLDVAALSVAIAERDSSGNQLDRGYLAWADASTNVDFQPASVSDRNDALVACVVDPQVTAIGTGGLDVGPQIVAVPGVSGTITPRSDSDIFTYLGGGGFLRLADVPIASTDTEINLANISTSVGAYQGKIVRIKQSSTLAVASTTPTLVPGATEDVYFRAGVDYEYVVSVDFSRTAGENNPLRVAVYVDGAQATDTQNIVIGEGVATTLARGNGSVGDWLSGYSEGVHTVEVRAYHDSGTSSSWTVNAVRLVITVP